MSFTIQCGHMMVVPLLDGKPTTMWVDTGAQFTTLTAVSAHRLALPLVALPGFFEGVGGSRRAYGFVTRHL